MSNIIVTGGCGFIGSHLVDALCVLGHHVTVIDNASDGWLNPQANLINKNINDKSLFKLIQKTDYIFHLAAQINLRESIKNPYKDAKTNILGSIRIIDLAKKCNAKLIFASTGGAIYSPRDQLPWNENSLALPESPYGIAKLTVENYLRISNIDHCILRLSNVYGPRQNPKSEAGVVSIFINQIINGSNIRIFGNGHQTRDFIYVSDVVNALILAMNKDMSGIYNVSTNEEHNINEIANLIIDTMWANTSIVLAPAIPGELQRSCLDNQKLKNKGWTPKIKLEEGLSKTIQFFTSDI